MAKTMIVEVETYNDDLTLVVRTNPEEFLKAVAEHKDGEINYVNDRIHFVYNFEEIKSLEVKFE